GGGPPSVWRCLQSNPAYSNCQEVDGAVAGVAETLRRCSVTKSATDGRCSRSTVLAIDLGERRGGKNRANLKFDKEITALLVIDPYNDFISEGGKIWDRLKTVAEANECISHMVQVLTAARQAKLHVCYAVHRRDFVA